jgi:hypothetical protein
MCILLLETPESGVSLTDPIEECIRVVGLLRCPDVKEEVSDYEIH